MTTTKKKKSAREKRVLVASIICAGLIVAGSTFAWFTSKDEVTNRLSASANYGVSIVEDFTPPENMTPGQEVNKDVSVVNTGNIDALVRVQIENMLKIKSYAGVEVTDTNDSVSKYVMNDGTKKDNLEDGETEAYQLKNFNIAYPTIPADQTAVELSVEEYTDSNGNKHANEVSLIQAGGELVVAAGVAVDVNDQAVKSGDDENNDYHGDDQYKPTETGLYIFRRTYYDGTENATVRYSGYWYDKDDSKYYALCTDDTTVYLPDGAVTEGDAGTGRVVTTLKGSNIKIKTTKESNPEDTAGKFTYEFGTLTITEGAETWTAVTEGTATHIKLTYDPTETTDTTTGTADDAVFYIALDENWSDNWSYVDDPTAVTNGESGDASKTYGTPIGHFYLKDDLEAGKTSPKLITSVTMSNKVSQQAYVDLTYDINVVLDSIQITFDEDGYELMPGGTKASNAATPWEQGAKGTAEFNDVDKKEIGSITWAKES